MNPKILATALQARPPRIVSAQQQSGLRGDHDLNPDLYCAGEGAREAAVLVPLVARPCGIQVLLTRRSQHLSSHPGQIAFPGGCREPGDQGPLATALRETEEEIGLSPRSIEPLGQLDLYVTGTGFAVTPIVGWVEEDFPLEALALDRREVEEAFEVPLPFFLDPLNRQRHRRRYRGQERHYYVYPYRDYYIWGATAGMLNNLAEVLAREC
ncbi:MAG TPA: CoA pyrophosphatase [Kiloniellales bacterium]|nr:CoA pyrophosphatase [Kiloniellales bacterium]